MLRLFAAFVFVCFASHAIAAQTGIASWYGPGFCGKRTASGERFNCAAMTCAHRSLPFGTRVRVSTGKRSIVCRVSDRGPFVRGRIIDLSPAARRALGMGGTARVTIQPLR